jgi:ADP-heptose:LPS heptosyltransferase
MPSHSTFKAKHAAFSAVAQVERAIRKGRVDALALREVRNFLFLQYEAPLGSVVHATPLFESLKTAVPDAHIVVAASNMAARVLGSNPYVDHCALTANPFTNFAASIRDVRHLLCSMPPGPRCIVTTVGNQRTRLALLSVLVAKAARVGYTLAPELYDVPLAFVPQNGQIEGNLNIMRALGHQTAFCEPRVFFTQADADFASQWLSSIGSPTEAPRIACVTQNSGGQRNQWKQERFQYTIAELSRLHRVAPVFVGTAADAPAIEDLQRSLLSPGISLAGKTSVPQLGAVLAQCDLVLSLDTGTFHVARAVGLPGIIIAPAWQDPREWLPVNQPHYRVLRGPSIAAAPPGYCMEEISADQVIAATSELLQLYPSSLESRAQRLRNSLSHRH